MGQLYPDSCPDLEDPATRVVFNCGLYVLVCVIVIVIAIVIVIVIVGCLSLRNVRVKLPHTVRRGQNVTLKCLFDLEEDALYSVKWYKGRREFYCYTPNEEPPMKVFQFSGIRVDVSRSQPFSTMQQNMFCLFPYHHLSSSPTFPHSPHSPHSPHYLLFCMLTFLLLNAERNLK